MIKNLILSILFGVFLIGCGDSSSSVNSQEYKPLLVSDYSYTMGGKQSVSISIGKDAENYFQLTVHRNKIKDGVSIVREYNPQMEHKTKVVDASAQLKKDRYIFSLKDDYRSIIKLKINQLDYTKKEANVDIYLKLIDTKTDKYIVFDKPSLIIKDKMFENLIKEF